MKTSLVLATLAGILAFYYPSLVTDFLDQLFVPSHPSVSSQILHSLSIWEDTSSSSNRACKSVAVGYNSNLDLIVNAHDLLRELGLSSDSEAKEPKNRFSPEKIGVEIEGERDDEENRKAQTSQTHEIYSDRERLTSLEDLRSIFGHFFKTGSAAERFAEPQVWKTILDAAQRLQNKVYFTGGNAGLIANRFAEEGCETILLGGAVGDELMNLLSPSVRVPQKTIEGKNSVARVNQKEDEVHLIMEYSRGSKWKGMEAPRANRFIIQSDITNAELRWMEPFHDLLTLKTLSGEKIEVLVISGFHLLDGQSSTFRQERIDAVLSFLRDSKKFPFSIPVHFELASIGDPSFIKQLAGSILKGVDSIGLNEQELGSLYVSLGGTDFTSKDFTQPDIRVVLDSLHFVFGKLSEGADKQGRSVSRIHFHCLQFHVTAIPLGMRRWSNSTASTVAGSLAATRQACDNNHIQVDEVELQIPLVFKGGKYGKSSFVLSEDNCVKHWKEESLEFSFAPVLVCKKPTKTVGLGDAISTVGLLYHLPFSRK